MPRREVTTWVVIGLLALAARIAYVLTQPGVDPSFAHPMLDEAVYVGWARDVATGAGQPEGAFYLAPLYPNLLVAWVVGAGGRFGLLYLAQHAIAVASAGALAWTARRFGGTPAGIAAALLALAYHPALFFASRPLGETVAVAPPGLRAGRWGRGCGGPGSSRGCSPAFPRSPGPTWGRRC